MTLGPESPKISADQVIQNMNQGVLVTNAKGKITSVNSSFCNVTGYSPGEVIGKNPRILQSKKHPPSFYKRMWTSLTKSGTWRGEITNRRKNGDIYTEFLSITAIKNRRGRITHYLGVFTDISKRKQAEETIKHMAYFDPLTGLPNRSLFRDRLKQSISHARRNKQLIALLFLDLDRIKVINDTLGHAMGDRVLKAVAKRLKGILREGDTVARMGGDEFTLLLNGVRGIDDVSRITKKILETLKGPFEFGEKELYVTASVGISIYPYDSERGETLIKNADTAMYRAKRLGRNNFQLYTPAMKDDMFRQMSLEQDLMRALERNEFIIHYQPQINLHTGQIIGVEALVRWNHSELGTIYPQNFIPWAEESGLIFPIGEWVLRSACEQAKKWSDAGLPQIRVSVNLSAKQFKQKNLVSTIKNVLYNTKLPPNMLELEITESVVMDHLDNMFSIPHELKAMGIRLAIDDFGTGYSSLNYLKRIPVSTLKLDQSFIRDLNENSHDAAITSAVIALGHGLNLSVMAEGVETEGQLDFLRAHKCDGMQGYLFSRPVEAKQVEKLLRGNRPLQGELLFSDC